MIKVAHIYLGFDKLSWLRKQCIDSFKFWNPDWDVRLYKPSKVSDTISWNTNEYKVNRTYADHNNFEHVEIWDSPIGITEIHRADFFKYDRMYNCGGLVLDTDCLFVRPLPIREHEFAYCHNGKFYLVGVLYGEKGNAMCKQLMRAALLNYNPADYSCLGNVLFRRIKITGFNIPFREHYCHDYRHVEKIWEPNEVPDESISIHLYGGQSLTAKFENSEKLPDSMVTRAIARMK